MHDHPDGELCPDCEKRLLAERGSGRWYKPCPAAAKRVVQDWSDEAFLALVNELEPQGKQEVLRGFKPTKAAAANPLVRQRVAGLAVRYPEILIVLFIHPASPWREWRQLPWMLGSDWLRRFWRDLVRIPTLGRTVVLALCTATDKSIAARARRCLARPGLWDKELPPKSHEELPALAKELSGFSSLIQKLSTALGLPAAKTAVESLDTATFTAELERLQREVIEQGQRIAQHKNSADSAQTHLVELEKQLQAETKRSEKELRLSRDALRQAEAQAESRVQAGLASAMAAFKSQVLGLTPEFTAACTQALAPTTNANGELTARTARLLQQQQELNAKHAQLAGMRREIASLQDCRQRLATCQEESVIVLPELVTLDRDLEARINHLLTLPGVADDAAVQPELVRTLLQRVQRVAISADGLAVLAAMDRALEAEPLLGSIEPFWRQELRRTVERRRQAVTQQIAARQGAVASATVTVPPPGAVKDATQLEIWQVGQALFALPTPAPVAVIVDGYNLIMQWPDAAKVAQAGLRPVRQRLLDLCEVKARRFASLEVVFDGTGTVQTREHQGPVSIVFASAREAEQNADNYVVDACAKLAATGKLKIWVVTDDTGLRRRLRPHGAAVIACADFYSFLIG